MSHNPAQNPTAPSAAERERMSCELDAAVLLVEQAAVMLECGWSSVELERCAAVLAGAEALLRRLRGDLFNA